MIKKYNYVKETYFKLLDRELESDDVKNDLKKLYKYIIDNKLSINKLFTELTISPNYGNKCNFVKNKNTKTFIIDDLCVKFLDHAPLDAVNPCHPLIKITSKNKNCHYFQIIYTTTDITKWFVKERVLDDGVFLDSPDPPKDYYPFYIDDNVFHDTPIWGQPNFLYLRTKYWIAHCYAISVDYDEREITYLGGVQWGFKPSKWRIIPKPIYPKRCSSRMFNKDWNFFYPILKKHKGEFKLSL